MVIRFTMCAVDIHWRRQTVANSLPHVTMSSKIISWHHSMGVRIAFESSKLKSTDSTIISPTVLIEWLCFVQRRLLPVIIVKLVEYFVRYSNFSFSYLKGVRWSETNQLKTPPPWAYCEIPAGIWVRIWKEEQETINPCALWLSKGRLGLGPQVWVGANQALFRPFETTTCAK